MNTQQRYIAHFQPQAWVSDHAVDVDAQGEQEWDCTRFLYDQEAITLAVEIEPTFLQGSSRWLDERDILIHDPLAPAWVVEYDGPFTITVRHRTECDTGIPEVHGPAPAHVPTAEKLLEAIKSHWTEVYSLGDPDFVWDIELYQAAGLLSADYEHPTEDQLSGSIYEMRKALEALIAVAEPVAISLTAGAYVHHGDASRLADVVAAVKRVLANHG